MELLKQKWPKIVHKTEFLGFGLMVTQIKLFEDVTLNSGKHCSVLILNNVIMEKRTLADLLFNDS